MTCELPEQFIHQWKATATHDGSDWRVMVCFCRDLHRPRSAKSSKLPRRGPHRWPKLSLYALQLNESLRVGTLPACNDACLAGHGYCVCPSPCCCRTGTCKHRLREASTLRVSLHDYQPHWQCTAFWHDQNMIRKPTLHPVAQAQV